MKAFPLIRQSESNNSIQMNTLKLELTTSCSSSIFFKDLSPQSKKLPSHTKKQKCLPLISPLIFKKLSEPSLIKTFRPFIFQAVHCRIINWPPLKRQRVFSLSPSFTEILTPPLLLWQMISKVRVKFKLELLQIKSQFDLKPYWGGRGGVRLNRKTQIYKSCNVTRWAFSTSVAAWDRMCLWKPTLSSSLQVDRLTANRWITPQLGLASKF